MDSIIAKIVEISLGRIDANNQTLICLIYKDVKKGYECKPGDKLLLTIFYGSSIVFYAILEPGHSRKLPCNQKVILTTKKIIMKKACVIFCSLFVIYSCNSNKEKDKPTFIQKEKPVQSAGDIELQSWLKGKIWTADNDNAPMSLLKLKADGGYELKTDKTPSTWQIIGGKISLARLTEWPIEKLNDSTFRLYVKPTDKWYNYKYTSTIE